MRRLNAFPLLIVSFASILKTWEKELKIMDFSPEDYVIVQGTEKKRRAQLALNKKIVILNYDMIINYNILDMEWGGIIFDESHKLCNPKISITRHILSHTRLFHNPICALSGTPAMESPVGYASQFFAIDKQFMGYQSLARYLFDNWKFSSITSKWTPRRKRHEEEISEYISKHAYVVKPEDIGLDVPKLYARRDMCLNAKQERALDWAYSKKLTLNQVSEFMGMDARKGDMVYVAYENAICAGIDPKTKTMISLDKIKEVLAMYRDNPEPIVVTSYYKLPLITAYKMFKKAGIPCGLICGTLKAKGYSLLEYREHVRDRFQAGELPVLFGQSKIIKMGLDLSVADHMISLSNNHSAETRFQLELRITNLNKKRPVQYTDLVTPDRIDDKIIDVLKSKDLNANRILKSYIKSRIK